VETFEKQQTKTSPMKSASTTTVATSSLALHLMCDPPQMGCARRTTSI